MVAATMAAHSRYAVGGLIRLVIVGFVRHWYSDKEYVTVTQSKRELL